MKSSRSHSSDPAEDRTVDFNKARFLSPDLDCREAGWKCVCACVSCYNVNADLLLKIMKLWKKFSLWLELLLAMTLLGDFLCSLSDKSFSSAHLGNKAL